MKKIRVILLGLIVLLLTVSAASATVDIGVTSNVCRNPTDGYIDFEDGTDGAVVASSIPGVVFTNTDGLDWIYGDMRTGSYSTRYTVDGNFFGWLGTTGSQGKIAFTDGTATYVSALVSTYSGVQIDAYDADGTFLATSGSSPGNLDAGTMNRLTVDAPAGTTIGYVIVHDSGNYWLIDDICTDAPGVGPISAPEFPTLAFPVVLTIGFLGAVLLIQRTREN